MHHLIQFQLVLQTINMSGLSNNQNTNQNQDYNWKLEQQVNTDNMNEEELRQRKQALEDGNDPMDDHFKLNTIHDLIKQGWKSVVQINTGGWRTPWPLRSVIILEK